jgi:RimJ/RimL family protein N-acetyltransferase
VAGLIQWAFRNGARTILAHTFERHTPSLRVLEKCGFR